MREIALLCAGTKLIRISAAVGSRVHQRGIGELRVPQHIGDGRSIAATAALPAPAHARCAAILTRAGACSASLHAVRNMSPRCGHCAPPERTEAFALHLSSPHAACNAAAAAKHDTQHRSTQHGVGADDYSTCRRRGPAPAASRPSGSGSRCRAAPTRRPWRRPLQRKCRVRCVCTVPCWAGLPALPLLTSRACESGAKRSAQHRVCAHLQRLVGYPRGYLLCSCSRRRAG